MSHSLRVWAETPLRVWAETAHAPHTLLGMEHHDRSAEHRILIGNNLDILPGLTGQVFDLIYLDPPYNTGGKVVREYSDRFDDWSSFMAPRLAQMVPLLDELGVMIVSIDDRGRLFRVGDAGTPSAQDGRSFRPLIHPETGKECPVPRFGWRFSDETMDQMLGEGRIVFGPDETTLPKPKRLLSDHSQRTPTSVFRHERAGTKHLERIVGERKFPFPKDLEVMMHWIAVVAGPGARILDPFRGSGTTVEAAAMLNSEDGGSRTVTGITLDEGRIVDEVLRPRMHYVEETLAERVEIAVSPVLPA